MFPPLTSPLTDPNNASFSFPYIFIVLCLTIFLIAAMESSAQICSETAEKIKVVNGSEIKKKNKKKKNIKKRRFLGMKRFACFTSDHGHPTIESLDDDGNIDMESAAADKTQAPTHLVVMINGIIGSAHNWRFAAKQLIKKYPQDLIVHCSESNTSMLTLEGVDVTGNRLAEEVMSVIKRHPCLQKISFIGHSLGGLIARYAVAKLYEQDCTSQSCQENGACVSDGSRNPSWEHMVKDKIAGLEPINFVTVATPHLGSRGHKQIPMFCGSYTLERLASHMSWCLGRTGRHLFLTDAANGQEPLLLRMASDREDLKFLSALQSFKRRVVYANAHFDHIVGWSTSSLRRRNELPKHQNLVRNGKYPHILRVEPAQTTKQEGSVVVELPKTATMEENMIRGLTKVSWERVDVSFKGSKQRYLAHNTIQVNRPWMNSDGADVVQHMVDNFLI